MGRYDLPDPQCRHKATVRVSSHEDLEAGWASADPCASTYCCSREACLSDAREWLRASTRRDAVHVVPLSRAH